MTLAGGEQGPPSSLATVQMPEAMPPSTSTPAPKQTSPGVMHCEFEVDIAFGKCSAS
jgi:hypothetical protein